MAKAKTIYICSSCNHQTFKWIGCCPACDEWNTFEQQHISSAMPSINKESTLSSFDDVNISHDERLVTGIKEWDSVLGGGIVPGSFLIITGDPGIGKSTLLLHVAHKLSYEHSVIYVSSEESLAQIKKRALRLGINKTSILFSDQPNLQTIIHTAQKHKPTLLLVDSIQNCQITSDSGSPPGSISQLKQAGFIFMRLAKEHRIAVILTGHITKDGTMAGPKVLEHMVDGLFYVQAADQWHTRVVRSVKNRFGPINELGFFEMKEKGLEQITDINKHLLSKTQNAAGTILTCAFEGSRPLLLELQALCVETKFSLPQRVITGLDQRRVILIAAIIEKYLHIKLSTHDIFFKVSGTSKLQESASDLGIALALLSSYFQQPLSSHSLALGEISLSGHITPINHCDIRIKEAEKFGILTCYVADKQTTHGSKNTERYKNVYELLRLFPEG